MSSNTGALAPEVETTMCQHVIAVQLQTPFSLYATKRSASYLCPSCLCDALERRLAMPGQKPIDAAASVVFNCCSHLEGERACWPCLKLPAPGN